MNWLTWALMSAAFAAATAILSKIGLRGVQPDAAQLVRTAITLAVVAAVVIGSGEWRSVSQFTRQTWLWLALAGVATAASWICYYRALSTGDATRVAVVDKLSVVMIAVVATAGLGERLTPIGWLGVMLACAGAGLISLAR